MILTVRQKMLVARYANACLRVLRASVGLRMKTTCKRKGLFWELDLDEGIDLSIYLFGAYEPRTLVAYSKIIKPKDVVFDIGANVGAHTLHFAKLVGQEGKVLAFEPTDYAIGRLKANLALNPELEGRVVVNQQFLTEGTEQKPPTAIISRWPVGTGALTSRHASCGAEETTSGARAICGDEVVASAGISRLDFIKVDVDGNEYSVLVGLKESIRRFRPSILVEFAPFVYEGQESDGFSRLVNFLASMDYRFTSIADGRILSTDPSVLREDIIPGGGLNCLLFPLPQPQS